MPAAWSIEVVCTMAISCFPKGCAFGTHLMRKLKGKVLRAKCVCKDVTFQTSSSTEVYPAGRLAQRPQW